jgi:hypothetical protein
MTCQSMKNVINLLITFASTNRMKLGNTARHPPTPHSPLTRGDHVTTRSVTNWPTYQRNFNEISRTHDETSLITSELYSSRGRQRECRDFGITLTRFTGEINGGNQFVEQEMVEHVV